MRLRVTRFASSVALVFGFASFAADQQPGSISPQDVLQHLDQTIAWYQHINAVDQSSIDPENVLLQYSVRDTSNRVVQLAFAFAHAEANVLAKTGNSGEGSNVPQESQSLEQAASQANQRIANLESQIESYDQQIAKAPGRKRAQLTAQRDTLSADLELAKQFQAAVKTFVSFGRAPKGKNGGGGLLAQISDLEASDSVPRAMNSAQKTPQNNGQAVAPQIFHPETAGIITLITKTFALMSERAQISSLTTETQALRDEIEKLKTPLRTTLRSSINQGDAVAKNIDAQTDPAQLESEQNQLKQLAVQFKELSGVLTPLGEQGILVQSSRGALQDWNNALDQQSGATIRYLIIRLAVLGLAIAFLLVLSQLWHNAIFRYVKDARRRRQFILLRRVVITVAILLVVALGFFTSASSVATFAGFITAGLAVALQSVILSVVAYFFLIGRYGMRVGDRVTVSGVTGQVIEIGLVRFSIMEFAGTGVDVHPSGRVAVFANSIVFQPYALLRQAPGTDYVWHAVTITLAPDTEYEEGRSRLTRAVESVYNDYRQVIEEQHAAFEKSINLQFTSPKPVSRVHFTDAGCEIFIRYPVEAEQTAEIDEQIVRRMLEETEREPKLKLAPGGSPRVVSAT